MSLLFTDTNNGYDDSLELRLGVGLTLGVTEIRLGVTELRVGVTELRLGATELTRGVTELTHGVTELTHGATVKLGEGLTLNEIRPALV